MIHDSQRGSIFVEDAEILSHEAYAGGQHILRVQAPKCAARATPGTFAHLQCHPLHPMRRPLSIMRASPGEGWLELLYKVVGIGTELLAKRLPGEAVNLMGPIGNGFTTCSTRPRPLLIGGGVGIPPMVFLAETLRAQHNEALPFVIMGSEVPFPFRSRPSRFLIPGMPAGVIAGMPLLEDWGIPSRLASQQAYPGCFEGYVTELAQAWLDALDSTMHNEIEIFACGPHPMLEAVVELAQRYALPCQVSLEEFMACAVGGCAGCTVEVQTPQGPAMKRVCVDGPVFEGSSVFSLGA